MSFTGPPFHEYEERFLLSEIIKVSPVPATVLLNFIRDSGVEPAWTDIALPPGRSVTACQQAYNVLSTRTPPAQSRKRPYSPSMLVRDIQPRPPSFVTVNDPGQARQASPASGERPSKKRGRPSKIEHERRVAEAAARGETYPKKPRKPKTPRQSMEGVEMGGASQLETPWITSGVPVHSGGVEGISAPQATQAPETSQVLPLEEKALAGIKTTTEETPTEGSPPKAPAPEAAVAGGAAPPAMMFAPNTTGPPNESILVPWSSKKKKKPNVNASESAQPAAQRQHEEQRSAAEGSASSQIQTAERSESEGLSAGIRQHAALGSPQLSQNSADYPSSSGTGPYNPGFTNIFQSYQPDEQRQL